MSQKNSWKKQAIDLWNGWGWSILIAVLIATSFRSAIADWNDVPTGSMLPTIWEGDRIFVNKLAYDLKVPYTTWHLATWGDPKRGEIVVFFSPADGKRLVKRVVGIPGDEIALWKNQLLLNGKAVAYEPIPQAEIDKLDNAFDRNAAFYYESLTEQRIHPVRLLPNQSYAHTFAPYVVPQGSYFMMGDNRDNSADSRFFGPVERRRIVGQATKIVLSLNYKKYYLPRWNRFWHPLE